LIGTPRLAGGAGVGAGDELRWELKGGLLSWTGALPSSVQ
jgi:hypothetical protein